MKDSVSHWMTREIVSTSPGEPLYAGVELMAEKAIRHVMVLEDGRLRGMLSNRDIIRATMQSESGRLDLHETRIEQVMTPGPLETTTPGTSLGVAAELMLQKRVNALPVMDRENLVGILTTEDILAAVSRCEAKRPDL